MGLVSLSTYSFRNLADSCIVTDASEVFLIGENGQGKTNFLEAIYLLCYGSSFRKTLDVDLARFGQSEYSVSCSYKSEGESISSARVKYSEGKKTIIQNEKITIDRKDMISKLPCVLFSHSDIEFARGSPERRRWFFDQLISLYDLEYIDSLRKYKKILRARNLELKNRRGDLLEYLDTQLISQGFKIIEKREKAVFELSSFFTDLYKGISGISESIKILYYPSWKKGMSHDNIKNQLKEKRKQEFQYAATLSGPHRDRIEYEIDARSYSKTASTGQLRLLSLTLRLAQAIYYTKKTGRKPILLLDDVLLELDPQKRMKFIATLPAYDQAFFTFLPGEPLESYRSKATIIYCVADGRFTHKESK